MLEVGTDRPRVSTLHWCDRCHQAFHAPGIDLSGGPRVCPVCLGTAQPSACVVCGATGPVFEVTSRDKSERVPVCVQCAAGVLAEVKRREQLAEAPHVARDLAAEVAASRAASAVP